MGYLNGVIEKVESYGDKIRSYNAYTEDVRPCGNETNFLTNPNKRGPIGSAIGVGMGLGLILGGKHAINNCNTKTVSLFSHKIPPKFFKYTGRVGVALGTVMSGIGAYELLTGKQVNI